VVVLAGAQDFLPMHTTWHSLIWKEWHEHKWKLASIIGVLLGVTGLSMLLVEEDKFDVAAGILLPCLVPLALFVGLSVAASERARGSLPFMQALPISMWRVGLVKFLMGLATAVVPAILAVLSLCVWRHLLDVFGVYYQKRFLEGGAGAIHSGIWYLDVVIFYTLIAASLYVWSAAIGVNRKDEISAGAVALAGIVGWIAILTLIMRAFVFDSSADERVALWVTVLTLALAPGGVALLSVPAWQPTQLAVATGIMALIHLFFASLYVRRFGQISDREITSPQFARPDPRRHDWLAPPRQSALTAIAWKQVRESGPIAAVGLTGIVATTVLLYSMPGMDSFYVAYAATSAVLGSCLALVIGVGIVLHDLSPPLSEFWRARPINPDWWFWLKFTTGLMIVVVAIYVPLGVIAALLRALPYNSDIAAIIPGLHLATFAAAVAMTCLVRHAVYGAILSFAMPYLSVVTVWLIWGVLGLLGWTQLPEQRLGVLEETTLVVPGMILCFVLSTLVAWLAVRYDWGRKSRY
jgi:hypothetical protein